MPSTKVLAVIPVYHREVDMVLCLEAFGKTELRDIDLHVVFAVNGAGDRQLEYLKCISSGMGFGIPRGTSLSKILEFPRNPGKGVAVNESVKAMTGLGNKYDYLLSLDSDMVAKSPHWLQGLVDVLRNNPLLGAVVSGQAGNDCHLPVSPSVVDGLTYSRRNEGQAGGCLLTPFPVWKEIGGYLAHRVYGSDDAHYMRALYEHKYASCIAHHIEMYHPFPDDPGYSDWKARACRDQLLENEKKGYYGD